MRMFKTCCGDDHGGGPEDRAGRALRFGGHILLGALAVAAVVGVLGWAVMTAWNAVMPAMFHLAELEFWPAVALLVLARLLAGRLHHGGYRRWGRKGRKGRRWSSCCSDEEDGVPARPDLYAEWWWEEGQASFRAFQVRRGVSPASDDGV